MATRRRLQSGCCWLLACRCHAEAEPGSSNLQGPPNAPSVLERCSPIVRLGPSNSTILTRAGRCDHRGRPRDVELNPPGLRLRGPETGKSISPPREKVELKRLGLFDGFVETGFGGLTGPRNSHPPLLLFAKTNDSPEALLRYWPRREFDYTSTAPEAHLPLTNMARCPGVVVLQPRPASLAAHCSAPFALRCRDCGGRPRC